MGVPFLGVHLLVAEISVDLFALQESNRKLEQEVADAIRDIAILRANLEEREKKLAIAREALKKIYAYGNPLHD